MNWPSASQHNKEFDVASKDLINNLLMSGTRTHDPLAHDTRTHISNADHKDCLILGLVRPKNCHWPTHPHTHWLDPKDRLASGPSGANAVKKHAWFKDLNWHSLVSKDMSAPWVPKVSATVCTYMRVRACMLRSEMPTLESIEFLDSWPPNDFCKHVFPRMHSYASLTLTDPHECR